MAAPLMVPMLIALWLFGLVSGFALIYYGGMSLGDFVTGGGAQPRLLAAFRLSWVTLSTIGFVEISASNMAYSVTVALEAVLGSVILTFSITYFLSVHRSIIDYGRLVAELDHRTHGGTEPLKAVAAYLKNDDPQALERWLEKLHGSVIGVQQSLRRYPIVYFYRPQQRLRGLPYTLSALQQIAASLAWCLPPGHRIEQSPALAALRFALAGFVEDLRDSYIPTVHQRDRQPVAIGEFNAFCRGASWDADPWLQRFVQSCEKMGEIAGGGRPDFNPEYYRRYRDWLPHVFAMSGFVATVRRDLGYEQDLRPHRSSRTLDVLSRGPKQRPQKLMVRESA